MAFLMFDVVIPMRKGGPKRHLLTRSSGSSQSQAQTEPALSQWLVWSGPLGSAPFRGLHGGWARECPGQHPHHPWKLVQISLDTISAWCGRSPSLAEQWERTWSEVGGWETVQKPSLAQHTLTVTDTQQTQPPEWLWLPAPPSQHTL